MATTCGPARLGASKLLYFWVSLLFVSAILFHTSQKNNGSFLPDVNLGSVWLSWTTTASATAGPSLDLEQTQLLLDQRLKKLEELPVASFADALSRNSQRDTCSGREIQQNLEQYGRRKEFWKNLTEDLIRRKRHELAEAVRISFGRINATNVSEAYGTGRGIVYTAGNNVCKTLLCDCGC